MDVSDSHSYDAPLDAVLDMFADPDAIVARYEGMGHRDVQVLECTRDDDSLTVRTSRVVEVDLPENAYGHVDEGLAGMRQRLPAFLTDHGYPTDAHPSLAIASQEEVGVYNLDAEEQLVVAPELFVDLANDDLSLKPESPAFRVGFKPIDLSNVGLRGRNK